MYFNKLNGMGTREENQSLRILREEQRKVNSIKPIKIWDIWNKKDTEEKIDQKDELVKDKIRKKVKESNEEDS